MFRPSAKYARYSACASGFAASGSVRSIQYTARQAAMVAIGKGSGNLNGTPRRRALRSMSRREYAPSIGRFTTGAEPVTFIATPMR